MGTAHRSCGDLDAAISEFREAIRLKPDEVMFHCNLASVWAEKGEHEDAQQVAQAALAAFEEVKPSE